MTRQCIRWRRIYGLSLWVVLIAYCSGEAAQVGENRLAAIDALPPVERQARLVEAARTEGEAVVYLNLDQVVASALTGGFSKKYPGVNVQVGRFSGASIIARVDAESRAGKLGADVIMSGELGILVLIDRGVMARYRSPQLAAYPESFRDKDGFWNVNFLNVLVPAYNSRLVSKEDAPQRLDDLLRPRWKGKLAMDSQSYFWFGALLQHLGEDATLKLMRGLNEQNLHHVRGRRLLTQLVAAGEYDMAVETNLNTVVSMSQQGAPVWFAPVRPLFLRPSFLFMTRTAPHPFAGALLIDYLLSEEGQRILAAHDRMPAHPKVPARDSQLLKGLDVRMPDPLDIGRRYAALGKKYLELFPGAK
ncbi:MAG TPA: extracellular solute-binding protein [Candidatus Binatia bacterium]